MMTNLGRLAIPVALACCALSTSGRVKSQWDRKRRPIPFMSVAAHTG